MLVWSSDRLTSHDRDEMVKVLNLAVLHGLVREDWQVYSPDGERRWLLTLTGGSGPTSERAYNTRECMALCLGLASGIERLEVLQAQARNQMTTTSPEADLAYRRRMGDPDAQPQRGACGFEAAGLPCGRSEHGDPYHVQGQQVWMPGAGGGGVLGLWVKGTRLRSGRDAATALADPRLNPKQRQQLIDCVKVDPKAMLLGWDEKARPVVACRAGIPRSWRVWAVLRDGGPADVAGPVAA